MRDGCWERYVVRDYTCDTDLDSLFSIIDLQPCLRCLMNGAAKPKDEKRADKRKRKASNREVHEHATFVRPSSSTFPAVNHVTGNHLRRIYDVVSQVGG